MKKINERVKDIAEAAARNGLILIGSLLSYPLALHAALRVVPAALSLIEIELLKAPCDPQVFDGLIGILERACDTARQVLHSDKEAWSQSEATWRLFYGPMMVELTSLLRNAAEDLKEATSFKAHIIEACEAIENLGKAHDDRQREAIDLVRLGISGHHNGGQKLHLALRGLNGSGRSHCLALCVAEALRSGAKRVEVIGSPHHGVGALLCRALGQPSGPFNHWLYGSLSLYAHSALLSGHDPDVFICDDAEWLHLDAYQRVIESPRGHVVIAVEPDYATVDSWVTINMGPGVGES